MGKHPCAPGARPRPLLSRRGPRAPAACAGATQRLNACRNSTTAAWPAVVGDDAHRSRHCLPVLPVRCDATRVQARVPCWRTSSRTVSSSSLLHCLRCVPTDPDPLLSSYRTSIAGLLLNRSGSGESVDMGDSEPHAPVTGGRICASLPTCIRAAVEPTSGPTSGALGPRNTLFGFSGRYASTAKLTETIKV